ncbi:MAG: protein tyrosine phosphatase (PTP) superfamily phosphohydrolase (DUF442 family) [Candidatus Azotimanducaceae bacterium]|jgi:protein tyrosine phosphatase (PTP) superfamily phosphohydrolase (DUF442 family)
MRSLHRFLLIGVFLLSAAASANSLKEISNYIEYAETSEGNGQGLYASSGQPTKDDLSTLSKAGYQRVIYIALTTNGTALKGEDELVLENGMQYLHVPVDFSNPKLRDFQAVASAMQAQADLKTLLHCQVNLRASTFSFLYRVIHMKVPIDRAKEDLDSIWVPNPVWFKFIKSTLAHYNMSHECDSCDWAERDFDS